MKVQDSESKSAYHKVADTSHQCLFEQQKTGAEGLFYTYAVGRSTEEVISCLGSSISWI